MTFLGQEETTFKVEKLSRKLGLIFVKIKSTFHSTNMFITMLVQNGTFETLDKELARSSRLRGIGINIPQLE